MGAGTAVTGRVTKDHSELSTIKNPNGKIPMKNSITENRSDSRRKIQRRSKKPIVVCPVQKLFNTCKKVFGNSKSGVVPCQDNIEMLRAVLDEIKPEDVGVSPKMPYFRSETTGESPSVTYLHIYACHRFSVHTF